MPKLDDLLGVAPAKPRVKLDDLLGASTPVAPVAAPRVKLDDLLAVAPLPSPAKPLPYGPKAAPIPTAPTGNFATRAVERARANATQDAKPFPVDPARADALGNPGTLTPSNTDWRDLAKYRKPVPDEAEIAAIKRREALKTANALAVVPFVPRSVGDAYARVAGVSEEDIARRGRAQSPAAGVAGLAPAAPGQGVVTGYPAPPREIPVEESPELMERRRMLAEKAAAEAVPTARESLASTLTGRAPSVEVRSAPEGAGIAKRNTYGTVGEREGTEGIDYNPIGVALGAADELYRSGKSLAAPIVEGITGRRADIDTSRGFMPPVESPTVNVGRTVAGAPLALTELAGEKAAPLAVKIQNGDWSGAMDYLLGESVGNAYDGTSKAKNKGDGTVMGRIAAGLNSLEEGIANTPRELWGLASIPLHTAQGAYNFAANATRGDQPVRETFRPVVDTATGMASGTLRDTVKLAIDPAAKLEEGLLSTVATAAPFANATSKLARVDKAAATAMRLTDEATALRNAPLGGTGRTLLEVADESEKLRGKVRATEAEAFRLGEDAKKAAEAAGLDRAGYSQTGELDNLEIQAKARAEEAATARAERDAARAAFAQFDAANKPALDAGLDAIAQGLREAHLAQGVADAKRFAARAPMHYATLGATAVSDLIGIALSRKLLDRAGAANLRYFARPTAENVPYLEDAAREVGREAKSRAILAQEAYRAIPEALRPEVRRALHMEHTFDEGGFYTPGHNYTDHVVTYDNGQWGYTPYGRKWLDEQRKAIADADADIAAATNQDAVDAARSRKLAAEDAIQKSESHIAVANQYARPLAQVSDDLTADAIALGEIDPFDAEVWKAQREANIKAVLDGHDAVKAKAEAEFQKIAGRYRRDTSANVRGVERIAERVIGRASQRQQTAARQADALTSAELAAQERRLAPKDRVTGPAGDDAALRTREAEVAAERAANRRLGTRIADVRMQAGRDIAALDKPYSEAVKGITDRALRVIDRAAAARDKTIKASEADAVVAIEKLRSEMIPVGLRRTQWRQTYKTDAARDRRALTDSAHAGQAAEVRGKLGPTRESKELLGSELRAAKMPMLRREEEYGMSTRLGDEVNALMTRADDVATLKLYKELADRVGMDDDAYNANRAVDLGVENAARARRGLAPLENRSRVTETGQRYIKVPDVAKFPQMDGSPKLYGALAGKWVPEDLWFEMVNHQTLKTEMSGVLNRMISAWKYGKTVLSPLTHARNFLSNALLFAPMAGISLTDPRNWGHFWDALKDITKKEKSTFFREIEKGGMFDSNMSKNEMALKVLDDVHSGFVDHVTGPMAGFIRGMYELGTGAAHYGRKSERIARANRDKNLAALHDAGTDQVKWSELRAQMQMPTAGRKLKEGFSKVTDATRQALIANPGAVYRAQDDLFRLALANKLRAQGVPLPEIIAAGRRSFVDYANVPGFVQVLRAPVAPVKNRRGDQAKGARTLFFVGGQPFLAFTAAAVPMVKDWATKDPVRAALYMNLHETLSRANLAAMGMTEDDATALRKSGRTWEQGQALVGEVFPQFGRGGDGDPLAVDVNYLAPTGGLTPEVDPYGNQLTKAVQYLRTVGNIGPGPLLQPFFDAVAMRDSFTGRRLDDPGLLSSETAARLGTLLYQALLPPVMPSLNDPFGTKDINDPTRVKGGYQYEQIMSASQGAPDYAGRTRSEGEALAGIATGSKLSRMNVTDRALDHAKRVQEESKGAIEAATKAFSPYLRLAEVPEDTRAKILESYRQRMLRPMARLTDIISGLARGEGRNDEVVTGLAEELDYIMSEDDPEAFYESARTTLANYARELEQINAARRAEKDAIWRAARGE